MSIKKLDTKHFGNLSKNFVSDKSSNFKSITLAKNEIAIPEKRKIATMFNENFEILVSEIGTIASRYLASNVIRIHKKVLTAILRNQNSLAFFKFPKTENNEGIFFRRVTLSEINNK